MRTDKQYYQIFEVCPHWVYLLTGQQPPAKLQMRSIAIKELELIADGVVIPDDPIEPLLVVEFQERREPEIYARTAIKMAALQKMHGMRAVNGIIFFGDQKLDPQTQPWCRIIDSFVISEVVRSFATQHADHPLQVVFHPLLTLKDDELIAGIKADYHHLKEYPDLNDRARQVLVNVYESWMVQRFKTLYPQEIENMMLIDLPPLEETVSGKMLVEATQSKTSAELLVLLLQSRFRVPAAVRKQLSTLGSKALKSMVVRHAEIVSLSDLKQRIEAIKSR